ncbi:uncharacterized protein LOC112504174 [Cynara cardunculus var. scolymus]|uniref:uncharacterized protein LOC112504174 n=1 Tax=Cynara cardunculus var. scolymus TaxID=59895 RepID=UPI000D6285DB|nr:uncharacterized protein LOC112504174 [Cynara cardunculus var. scolymus]
MVPLGFLIMSIYHLFLLYRYLRIPETTAIGFENHNKTAWVEKMLQIEARDRGLAVSVLNSHLSAATSLSSISLALCSLIGAVLGGSSTKVFSSNFILGDTSRSTSSIKYVSMLSCFLLAFACFVQTTRHFVHANFLISIPNGDVPVHQIQKEVIRGSNFWAVGLRALYVAGTLVLWIFGPIPMFVSSVVAVVILHFVDTNKDEMIRYQSNQNGKNRNFLKKIEHNITSTVEAFDHDGRPTRDTKESLSSLEISDGR